MQDRAEDEPDGGPVPGHVPQLFADQDGARVAEVGFDDGDPGDARDGR